MYGGIVAVAAGHVVRIPLGRVPAVVVWIPDRETADRERAPAAARPRSRSTTRCSTSAHTALLVAALVAGDAGALRAATEDRLHQDRRLSRVPDSRAAMDAALSAGAWGAWLSGSGPSVAAFADAANADAVAPTGRARADDEGDARM